VTIGADILRAIPGLASAAPIVLATHERMDGHGYPAALVGDAIPLAARIIAVADVYDALTGVRPYREPVSRDQANAELVRASGRHLDPVVVRAWLGLTEDVRCS
jgi:putative two-component system response regulator